MSPASDSMEAAPLDAGMPEERANGSLGMRAVVATILLGSVLTTALPSAAADKVALTGWRRDCAGSQCRVYDRMTQTAGNAVIVEVSVIQGADQSKPTATLQLPLGMAVSEPVTLGIENGPSQRIDVLTCNNRGCFARDALDPKLFEAMKDPKRRLRVVYVLFDGNLNKRTLTVNLGLAGFASAYNGTALHL